MKSFKTGSLPNFLPVFDEEFYIDSLSQHPVRTCIFKNDYLVRWEV